MHAKELKWIKAWVKSYFRAPAECVEFVEFAWILRVAIETLASPRVSPRNVRERIPPFWIVADFDDSSKLRTKKTLLEGKNIVFAIWTASNDATSVI